MNRKAAGIAAVIAASLALLYILTRDEPKAVALPVQATISTEKAVVAPEPRESESAPPTEPPFAEVKKKATLSAALPPDPSKVPLASSAPGSYAFTPSVEWRTYILFNVVGHNSRDLKSIQQQFDLTDEELAPLVEYSRSVVQADVAYQTELQASICSKRDTFQSLEAFGAAMNEQVKKVQSAQEDFGRKARDKLGPALFAKIDAGIRSQPASQLTRTDFSIMLVERNADLQATIERACRIKI